MDPPPFWTYDGTRRMAKTEAIKFGPVIPIFPKKLKGKGTVVTAGDISVDLFVFILFPRFAFSSLATYTSDHCWQHFLHGGH